MGGNSFCKIQCKQFLLVYRGWIVPVSSTLPAGWFWLSSRPVWVDFAFLLVKSEVQVFLYFWLIIRVYLPHVMHETHAVCLLKFSWSIICFYGNSLKANYIFIETILFTGIIRIGTQSEWSMGNVDWNNCQPSIFFN